MVFLVKARLKLKVVTDEQLMMLINAGDLQVMQVLFDRYSVRIYRYCIKVTNERMASEDLTQETFYKAMNHRESFNNKTFAGWIFTIARNLCFDYLKKREKEGATIGLESYEENYRDDEALEKQFPTNDFTLLIVDYLKILLAP